MIQCEVAIAIEIDEGTEYQFTEWFVRDFPFFFVPRIGERIWLGDHLEFDIENVEHGFTEDEPPKVRVVVSMDADRFDASLKFLEGWGFSKAPVFKGEANDGS
jgi:hypothetical protein